MTKQMILTQDARKRKQIPIYSGLMAYFPLALAEVAKASWQGNQQHHPDKPLHWDRTKSTDHLDCIGRHLLDSGTIDNDNVRHSTKLAWRALANLEIELEEAEKLEEVGVYHQPTLDSLKEVVYDLLDNCTEYSSPYSKDHDLQIIAPYLEAILDEIEYRKGK